MSSVSLATPSPHLKALTNFCSEWFVDGVSCSCVTADRHPPSNLVSTDPQTRSRGLRVEHYIRPPVTITVELSFPVTVQCVLLSLDLPQQAQGRVELVGSVGRSGGEYRLSAGPLVGTSGVVLAARSRRQPSMASKLSEWVVHRSYARKELQRQDCAESPLRDGNAARHLKQLQVKISRWTGPKAVSIKWLEIWGVLSTACSREEKTTFLEKFQASIMNPKTHDLPPGIFQDQESRGTSVMQPQASVMQLQASAMPSVMRPQASQQVALSTKGGAGPKPEGTASDQRSHNVPEEFLDALTYELMVLPMLLPSGHCVDSSTVDKLARADAMYGRQPTDPFTGIAFTESCKPEFSVHLKSQLDQYLSSTQPPSCSTGSTGQTLGSSQQIWQHRNRTKKSPVSGVTWVSPDTGDTLEPPVNKRSRVDVVTTSPGPDDTFSSPKWFQQMGIESEHPVSSSGPSSGLRSGSARLGDHKSPVGQEEGQETLLPHRMPQHGPTPFDFQVDSSLEVALQRVLQDKQC